MRFFSLYFSIITCISFVICAHDEINYREPILKNGRYYYSNQDTTNQLLHAMMYLPKKFARSAYDSSMRVLTGFVAKMYQTHIPEDHSDQLIVPFPEPMQSKPAASSTEPIITWIGHASFLIQIDGFNILTDPLFGSIKAGRIHIGDRVIQPGIKLEDLPPIDAILISHNHADHMCKACIQAIYKKYPQVKICVGLNNGSLLEWMGINKESIIEKSWWHEFTLEKNNKTITLTFLPAKHWSIYSSPFEYRKALWGSWMISAAGKNIYFAGDTAYDDHFKQIAHKFTHIDVALMPIAPTRQNADELDPNHVNAKEAIDAFIDLNADCFIPMHYATVFKGKHSFEYPINLLFNYWNEKENELATKKLLFARCGQPYNLIHYEPMTSNA